MQYKLATFGRGKDKVKRKSRGLGFFGDKKDDDGKKTVTLREPVLKRGLIGGAIGGGLGLAAGGGLYSVSNKTIKDQFGRLKNVNQKRRAVRHLIKQGNGLIKLSSRTGLGANLGLRPSKKLLLIGALGGATLGSQIGAINGLMTYGNRKRVFNDEKIKKDYKLRDNSK